MDKAEVAVDDEGQHSPSHDAGAVNADERCPKLRGQQGGRRHGLHKPRFCTALLQIVVVRDALRRCKSSLTVIWPTSEA